MDLENQKRVKDFAEKYGPENVVVLLGAAEGEAAGLAAETVTAGDPTFAGPLAGVQLGLTVYHICEDEIKAEVDPGVYDEQISMMEMVMDVDDIHTKKQLEVGQKILDYMGSTELIANLFRISQTEEKLRRENVQGENNANMTHYHVGQKVRQTIKELGGTMPEELPTPEKSIKQIEREQKKLENK